MSTKNSRRIFLAALLCVLSLPAHALQNLAIPDNGTGTAKISLKEVNRIAVANGRIRNVFGADGSLQINIDEEKGDIYVRPLDTRAMNKDGVRQAAPVNLFLTDSLGRTYTLLLEVVDVPAETIIISGVGGANRRTEASTAASGREQPYITAITDAMRAMSNDETPDGYSMRAVNTAVPLWKETSFVLQNVYTGDGWVGERYVLTNTTREEMRLLESEFKRRGVLAVGIENAHLRPGEKTLVLILREAAADER